MATIGDMEKELAALRAKQAEVEAELQRRREIAKTNPLIDLAEHLHEKFCRWNHTDGCGWFYEKWPGQNGSARQTWLATAQKVQECARRHGIERPALDDLIEAIGECR